MAPVLFDTSVYISALRKGDSARLALRNFAPGSAIWLSSVVLEELYAGADTKAARVVQRLERDFDRARRILIPTLSDWTATGKTLAHLAVKYHYEQIGQGRLTNDALIAMSAARMGVTVITANPRDFQKLAEFRAFSWKVAVV